MSQGHTTRKPQWGLKPWPKRPQEGSKIQTVAGRQFKGQTCARKRGSFSPGPSSQPNGQKGNLGRPCALPGLGQRWRPLPTCLFLIQESPALSLSQADLRLQALGNLILPAPAQPGSQDMAWGRGSKEHEDEVWAPLSYLQSQTRADVAPRLRMYSPVTC